MRKRWVWIAIVAATGLFTTTLLLMSHSKIAFRLPASQPTFEQDGPVSPPQAAGNNSPTVTGSDNATTFSPDGSRISKSNEPPVKVWHKSVLNERREPSDEEVLEDSLTKLKKGNLSYSTPEKMKTGRTEHVTARIAGSEVSIQALSADLPTGKDRTVAAALTPISPRMKMELKSADFDITPLSSEEQGVGGDTPTTWEWDIAAKHAGKLRLHLAAVVELKNLSRDFTSIDRDITVQVDPVDAVSGFVRANWQWVIATLTAISGAAWKFLKDRKKKPEEDSPTAGAAGM